MTPRKALLSLLVIGLGAAAQAQSQLVSFYFNVTGSSATEMPTTINVAANSSVTLRSI